MRLAKGTRIGHYEVSGLIGVGGMGEVYRAHDTKLNRDAALKFLPDAFVHDPERLARFKREAQVLASLNHTNIAHVYGVEDSEAGPAMVMELVDGPTLADVIAAGTREDERVRARTSDSEASGGRGGGAPRSSKIDDALSIARQIADALDAAHERGVIHRDLKPANVKVTADGTVKVLDFGLAKAIGPEGTMSSASPQLSTSPTLTSPAATALGMILGTAAYMSPEQARGRIVDKRADIWAFGCVLYEMLTGRQPFPGEDVAETIGAVIHKEPDYSALPADTPPNVRLVIERCLKKDPRQRLRDIGDVKLALDGAFETAKIGTATVATARRSGFRVRTIAALAAISIALAAGTGVGVWSMMRPAPSLVVKLTAHHPIDESLGGTGIDIAVTPDGRRLVYIAGPIGQRKIYVRAFDGLEVKALVSATGIAAIFVSPDSQWIGYVDNAERSIKKVQVTGGAPELIAKISVPGPLPLSPTWGLDGRIVTTLQGQLWSVPATGGTFEPLLAPNESSNETFGFPEFLPDGRSLLFTVLPEGGGLSETGRLEVLTLATRTRKRLLAGGIQSHYVQSGHLVYTLDGALRAVPLDLGRLEVTGPSVPVLDSISTRPNGLTSVGLSKTGTLAYIRSSGSQQMKRTVVWVDRRGNEEATDLPARAYVYARLSPDESRLALDIREDRNDIWTWDLARKTLTRLTVDPGLNRGPVWTPDGTRVAFSVARDGVENTVWQRADGSTPAEPLTRLDRGAILPRAFSPKTAQLLLGPAAAPFRSISIMSLTGEHRVESLMTSEFNIHEPELSPDGNWVAYQSNESGRYEIYVRPFPDVTAPLRLQASNAGGTRPLWSRDGKELFYSATQAVQGGDPNAGTIHSVEVLPGIPIRFGTPKVVVKGPYLAPFAGRHYDASRSGRFLMIKDARTPDEIGAPPEIIVVQNWIEELKKIK